ncbi:MAG: hypothetical protein EIB84_00320 (plasmid) [Spiroplasma poulsonii]|uniref:Uncharacterized protein n=2 Tax=Spiroplasma poulsonii TaxID=2138 RepID=A0A2P6FEK8_9MOLU|nr:hypothetical protein [Spiroplasma poulsonii]KAF0850457.1 hypothetical protein MSROBK_017990 [Spiroplasma poulsonii]MBW1241367.1 hypothetical protein [Spiroplasma poulsonii]PQM31901.1 hypothetical protein SMSRO_SF017620 [Spiroplasma poulsonii]PWF94365.1 hypothetical protein SMH99_23490 [Spiroplasma poulsonii]
MTFLDFLEEINMESNLVICFNNKDYKFQKEEYLRRNENIPNYIKNIPNLNKCKIVDIEFLTKEWNNNLKITLI